MKAPAKKLTPKQEADKRYRAKIIHKRVVFNIENKDELNILDAFEKSGLEFSTLCKRLLSDRFNLP